MNYFTPHPVLSVQIVAQPFPQSNIVQLLVVSQSSFVSLLVCGPLLNQAFFVQTSDVIKSTYGDIYKREKCLLVASVHDLLAGEMVLPGQMLLNVIYVLIK